MLCPAARSSSLARSAQGTAPSQVKVSRAVASRVRACCGCLARRCCSPNSNWIRARSNGRRSAPGTAKAASKSRSASASVSATSAPAAVTSRR